MELGFLERVALRYALVAPGFNFTPGFGLTLWLELTPGFDFGVEASIGGSGVSDEWRDDFGKWTGFLFWTELRFLERAASEYVL